MMRHLLKTGLIFLTLIILFMLSACDNKNNSTQTSSKSLSECLTWLADKKTDNNKYTLDVKIPQLNFDKPVAKSINEEIKAKFYTNDVVTAINGGFEGIQLYIRTDSSLNGIILSVRIKQELYPSYGTDGDIYCVLYDISKDAIITPAQYLKDKGMVYETVANNVKTEFGKLSKEPIEYFNIEGIYINEKGQTEIVAVILTHPPKADAWKYIYYYTLT